MTSMSLVSLEKCHTPIPLSSLKQAVNSIKIQIGNFLQQRCQQQRGQRMRHGAVGRTFQILLRNLWRKPLGPQLVSGCISHMCMFIKRIGTQFRPIQGLTKQLTTGALHSWNHNAIHHTNITKCTMVKLRECHCISILFPLCTEYFAMAEGSSGFCHKPCLTADLQLLHHQGTWMKTTSA